MLYKSTVLFNVIITTYLLLLIHFLYFDILLKHNIATRITGIGEIPMQYPAVEQWFKRLSFYFKTSKSKELGKKVLLSSCGKAFSLIETILAPQLPEIVDVTMTITEEAVKNRFRR